MQIAPWTTQKVLDRTKDVHLTEEESQPHGLSKQYECAGATYQVHNRRQRSEGSRQSMFRRHDARLWLAVGLCLQISSARQGTLLVASLSRRSLDAVLTDERRFQRLINLVRAVGIGDFWH